MTHRQPEPDTRPAIPDDNAPLPPARWPTRWTVRRGRSIAYVLVGLALAASLLSVYLTYRQAEQSSRDAEASSARAAQVEARLDVLEEDLADRTRQRDAERDAAAAQAERDREQFRAHFCEVLTELSVTFPNLDGLREALGCPQPPSAGAPQAGAPSSAPSIAPRQSSATPSASTRPPTPATQPSPTPSSPPVPAAPDPGPGDLICHLLPLDC